MFLERSAEGKKIIWSEQSNRYLLMEPYAYEVMMRLVDGVPSMKVIQWMNEFYGLPKPEGRRFVEEVKQMLELLMAREQDQPEAAGHQESTVANRLTDTVHYQIYDLAIQVEYENDSLKTLIHPKFAHLESGDSNSPDHIFRLNLRDEKLILSVDGVLTGIWKQDRSELLVGKFFVELLNRIYRKVDDEWLAVIHASAMTDGNQAILFAGGSGSGKTTLSALLMSRGYRLVSDDLVPVDAAHLYAYSFPAALSIKEKALNLLLPIYPGLQSADEFFFSGMNKTVRYLAPDELPDPIGRSMPCKAIVFLNYLKDSGLILEVMPKTVAFQQLIPDSWISPVPRNAEKFLDWFLAIPCYRLIYSDNDKVVKTIKQLFEHD